MQPCTPAAPAVRETLERVLASETFARSERARNLLRYLVEREQAGEADRLKGFSIAVDVFGKDADFDSATDAVVRVQAGRLRDLLQQYSDAEGAGDAIRIVVPRGSYVPFYQSNPAQAAAPCADDALPSEEAVSAHHLAAAASASPLLIRQIRFFWLAIALVVVMLGVLIVRQDRSVLPSAIAMAPDAEASVATGSIVPSPTMEALPLVYLAINAHGAEADRVVAALRAGLPGFDTVDFIGRDIDENRDRSADGTSFIYELRPGPATGDVTIELQNVETGRVILARTLSREETRSGEVEDRVAGILSATVPASGAIYAAIQQSGQQDGLVRCLLLNEAYYLDQNADSHEKAYRCLEGLANRGAQSTLVYSELASLQLEAVTDRYPYPPGASMEKALAFAHTALQRGATSPNAHRAYGYLNARRGKSEDSIRWMRKAYELNTYDLSMAAAYAYGLIFAGHYAEGMPIIARAVDASSSHPSWWDFAMFLGAFMQGDMRHAADAADTLTSTAAKSHYLAARLIVANMTGDGKTKRAVLAELTANFPKFVADPRRAFARRNYPDDLTDKLVEALRAAGLGGAS